MSRLASVLALLAVVFATPSHADQAIVNVPDPHPPCEASGAPLCTNGRCAVGTCVSLISTRACQ